MRVRMYKGRACVVCPYCTKVHYHGVGKSDDPAGLTFGQRQSHCKKGMYILENARTTSYEPKEYSKESEGTGSSGT